MVARLLRRHIAGVGEGVRSLATARENLKIHILLSPFYSGSLQRKLRGKFCFSYVIVVIVSRQFALIIIIFNL
jgi:hypothetical protein